MNGLTVAPPFKVLHGFAKLMTGLGADGVALDSWPEPWRSVGQQVAGSNGHRREVLRACIQQHCGEQAEDVTRSIFAIDPTASSERAVADAWGHPVPFHQNELPPFPTEVFPNWLREFIEAEAEATQTPPDMAALMAFSVLGLALAKKVTVRVRPGWIEPVNIWTMTTMEPANRKSAVVRDLMDPVVVFQRDEALRLAPSIRDALARRKIIEARCEYTRTRAAKAMPPDAQRLTDETLRLTQEAAAVDVPVSPKLWTDDCTPEMMGSLLSEHEGRMAIISAEGNIFELMAGRYSKGRPNIGVYLAGHAGDPYMVDRRGRPSEYVPQAAVTIGITVQREVLRGLAERPAFRGCGLLARFLYSVPKSWLGRRKSEPPAVPSYVRERYRRNIMNLLTLPFGTDENNEPAARTISLDAAAHTLFKTYQEQLEPQLAPYGELGHLSDWAGKLCGAIARLAALLHAAEAVHTGNKPWDWPITGETMTRTLQLAGYLVAHARAAFAEMGTDPLVEQARFVLGWLERKDLRTFTQRDLFEGVKGDPRFKRVESLRPAIDLLLEHGWLRRREAERTGPGRKPSPMFELNPHAGSSPTGA